MQLCRNLTLNIIKRVVFKVYLQPVTINYPSRSFRMMHNLVSVLLIFCILLVKVVELSYMIFSVPLFLRKRYSAMHMFPHYLLSLSNKL